MKAIRVHEYGQEDKLTYEQIPVPIPGPGQVRVKVEAIGLNFVDIYNRKGLYGQPLPFTPGTECAGVVDAVGEGVSDFAPGDRVATERAIGSYAELTVAPAIGLYRLPEDISARQAAATMLQGLTAHYLTSSTYPLKRGETALVHAAAGGVGLLLVQMAKRTGARVIGTVSTEEKAVLAGSAGADDVILYQNIDFARETRRLTDGRGVEVVYDSVGQATFDKSLDCLKPRGYLVLFGQSSGPVPPVDPQILNRKGSLFLTRPTLGSYTLTREEFMWRANDIFGWLAAGELSVRIDRIFPLAEAAAAHRYLENRQSKGKILLTLSTP